tara:strand:- start:359 stop:616 length:258 start_codon:yes stop_codon:yes gene_type:complete
MAHVNVSEFRQNLAAHLEDVSESRAPLVVTRGKGKSVVVLSEEEYESMAETLHLLASPENARRLREAVSELDAGQGESGVLDESE